MRYMNRATGAIIEPPEGAERMCVNHSLYAEEHASGELEAAQKKRASKNSKKEEA